MTHKITNNYQRVLGVSFLILVFASVVSLVYLWQVSHSPKTQPNYVIETQKVNYHNDQYRFELEHTKSQRLDTSGSQPNYFTPSGKTLASISLPREAFPNTNFNSGEITLAVKEKATAADCQTYVTGADSTKKMTRTIAVEGHSYYTDSFIGAAAGTKYESKIYRMRSKGNCYEANLTVGISNIGNYAPGAVLEVVEADVWNVLSHILVSFKFDDEKNADTPQI